MLSVIALDLEGTLISNAASQIPRPGLYQFLVACKEITPRVVIYTTVGERRFRDIANILVEEELAPVWFKDIEYIQWAGVTKDLRNIPESILESSILVDDFSGYIHGGQKASWIQINQFDYPYPGGDREFEVTLKKIQGWLY